MAVSVSARVTQRVTIPNDAVEQSLRETVKMAAGAGFDQSQVIAGTFADTSDLLHSGFPPREVSLGILGKIRVEWGYTAPHALPVEFGSRPHWAPIEPLKGWARRVLGDESAAYAVRQKIADRGTEPHPFVRPGILVMTRVLRGSGIRPRLKANIPGL